MNALASYYLSLIFVVLAVLSNRYWRRQLNKAAEQMVAAREASEKAAKRAASVAAECMALGNDVAALTKRADKVEAEYQVLTAEKERKRAAHVEKYYIFDRSQPRAGGFWEVAVRCTGDTALSDKDKPRQTWVGVRTYLLIADNEGSALRRAQARFPQQEGYQVIQAVACRIPGLQISRVEEFSTYRRKEVVEAS
jgi:hypothetical protein